MIKNIFFKFIHIINNLKPFLRNIYKINEWKHFFKYRIINKYIIIKRKEIEYN